MTAVHVPIEKTTVHEPVWLSCRLTVPRGLGRRQLRRVRVNDLSSLYPESQLRAVVLRNAARFCSDMAKQGYDLLTAEADVLITGPYEPRQFNRSPRPVMAPAHVGRGQHAVVPVFSTNDVKAEISDREDYVLEAQFLASRARLVEYAIKEPAGAG